jgi:hypothetical protein
VADTFWAPTHAFTTILYRPRSILYVNERWVAIDLHFFGRHAIKYLGGLVHPNHVFAVLVFYDQVEESVPHTA